MELAAIKPWITRRISELLGFEDEIVVDLCVSLLEDSSFDKKLCPKQIQLQLTGKLPIILGFLEKNSGVFMLELWKLLIEAQNSENGIVRKEYSYLA